MTKRLDPEFQIHVNNTVKRANAAPKLSYWRSNTLSGPPDILTTSALEEALRCWVQRTRISEEDFDALRALPFTRRVIERDGFVIREGEQPTACSLLVSGSAFRQKVVRSGARQIISFHFPGEFIDLQSILLDANDHGVQALGACELAVVPKKALLELIAQRPGLGRSMWFDTLVEGAIFREWVVNVGRRNARARIAHLLCELAVRLDASADRSGAYELPLTQEQIADATGMTSVHTNRVIQALRREGLISMAGGRLVVHDWDGLRTLGDFNELYLHRNESSGKRD